MNQILIQDYLNDLSDLRKASGSNRESVVSEAFKDLLKGYAKSHDLIFLPQYELPRQDGARRIVDGALVYDLRVPFGYWEAKDEEDDLDEEITKKLRRGYPRDNIIFEDSRIAVLMQRGNEVMRCAVEDTDRLQRLLDLFFAYERPEVADFRKAVVQFQKDLPDVLAALRDMINAAQKDSTPFRKAATKFLEHAKGTINEMVTADDVREMLIQHILTEEIFSKVFDEDDFHRQNNVAKELYTLENLFFTGARKKNTLKGLEPYYNAIRTTAHQIATHTEKQTFLKVIYEGFYKVYNKKAADRLGVVYTPNEIVRFMVESADWLCQKHFSKSLIDRDVQILDPATGTGTFICELLEHFRGQKEKLAYKYKEELHANEVAILPYYVANLNIEATYAAITGQYAEFPNLCFVDTLDNVGGLGIKAGHQHDLFGAMSEENVARIKRQNSRKISVVIGNPPYNANQQNENDNNKNRAYPRIDERIKGTYIKQSTAQKTKAYDMYTRFFRWASDRLHDDGILAFITNRNFIDSRTMDGFRRAVAAEYSDIYVVDLGGDVRANPKLSGTRNNVFGIQTGIAISFLVKRRLKKGKKHLCAVHYVRRPEMETADDKLSWLEHARLSGLPLETLHPDAKANWINQTDNDFDTFIPIADKKSKVATNKSQERAIFKLYSLGISTNRDEWLYDIDRSRLTRKMRLFVDEYDRVGPTSLQFPESIKWSRNLKRRLSQGRREPFQESQITVASYRPYCQRWFYQSCLFIDEPGSSAEMFPPGSENLSICFSDVGSRTNYCVLAVDGPADLHFGASVDAYQQVARFRFVNGESVDNITDWALQQFRTHYASRNKPRRPISKDDVFRYVYAVLHDPIYREKYAQNLKREFPRIPFYDNFTKWANWGEALLALHIGYEMASPWQLQRIDVPDAKSRTAELSPKPLLKADKDNGIIFLDSETQLSGVPPQAWTYRLGNRSALEWILDQYKEKTPKDPTIREKFNTYRFADHKEKVIDLLMKVTRVSVETMKIVEAMRKEPRAAGEAGTTN
ncbi:N-6 DNA methylase [Rhodopseudomonas palustris]|uniref:type ISP restriction/modification enzyme n=1 Tax=Rhodopseudomonas palustris TaxID=1076 RepID=UPI0020CF5BD0|nr:type ISP restriction/modification enzyme [Rhodopseudomonas palustris]MCP9629575.1 N-6 DNA methylase [Rhodopseudomonas palustris]